MTATNRAGATDAQVVEALTLPEGADSVGLKVTAPDDLALDDLAERRYLTDHDTARATAPRPFGRLRIENSGARRL
jgi:hypothetical protein